MKKVLDAIIGKNSQLLSKKELYYTLSTIHDITDMSNTLKKYLAVISLDFLKAFDRVDWVFVFSVLYKFGYRNKFILMIQVAYTNIQSKIKINGLLFEPYTFMREV